jgi:hypothetical protein
VGVALGHEIGLGHDDGVAIISGLEDWPVVTPERLQLSILVWI